MGRVEVGFKIGGSPENLVFLLLVARYLSPLQSSRPFISSYKPVGSGLVLLAAGLLIAGVVNPSSEGFEDILRFVGQAVCGLLIAERIFILGSRDLTWTVPWVAGFVVLLIRTPWMVLDNPNLDGSFTHRNLQSAYFLLSIPLLAFLWHSPWKGHLREVWDPRKEWVRKGLSLLLFVSIFLFLYLSRSRSGIVGLTVLLTLLTGTFVLRGRFTKPRTIITLGIIGLLLFGVGVLFSDRFKNFGQEIGDPYHRSRSGIWAAAVYGWTNPSQFLVGVGMGDSFDRVLLDSPTGNLNYRYRKAHYPHCLYFHWIYWGGLTALIGWFYLFYPAAKRIFVRDERFYVMVVACALLGYAFLELFESAFREPRVAVLFWINIGLLNYLLNDDAPPLKRSSNALNGRPTA